MGHRIINRIAVIFTSPLGKAFDPSFVQEKTTMLDTNHVLTPEGQQEAIDEALRSRERITSDTADNLKRLLKQRLNIAADPVGDTVEIHGFTFRCIGCRDALFIKGDADYHLIDASHPKASYGEALMAIDAERRREDERVKLALASEKLMEPMHRLKGYRRRGL